MITRFILTIFVAVCANIVFVLAAPTVNFPFGIIQGSDLVSQSSGRPVFAYYGIPFAEPPTGDRRFRAPQPYVGPGPGTVISSRAFRASCMQPVTVFGPFGEVSEDCLHLNIFAPGSTAVTPRKVIVFIHGGGYTTGDAVFYVPTDWVADQDVIVVTIQYRLGYFGFLATGQRYGEGPHSNNGLRDQILALQWVRDNIGQFGGSGSDVTIVGESAGSTSVSLLSLSPLARGLFSRAVMQSGTAVTPFGTQSVTAGAKWLEELAGRMGCLSWYHYAIPGGLTRYHGQILDCLRQLPAANLTNPEVPESFDAGIDDMLWAAPYVDGDVIPDLPETLVQKPEYLRANGVLDRDYIIGATNLEGYPFGDASLLNDEGFNGYIKAYAKFYHRFGYNQEMQDLINFVYSYPRPADGKPSANALWDLLTDALFMVPSVEFADRLLQADPSTNVYFYLFDHYPDLIDQSKAPGTPHATDLVYLFDEGSQTPLFAYGLQLNLNTPDSSAMKDVYRGTLAEFAKTGNPSRSRSGGSPAVWPRYDLEDRQYMALSPRPQTGSRVYSQRISLWQDFLPKVATNIFTGRRNGD